MSELSSYAVWDVPTRLHLCSFCALTVLVVQHVAAVVFTAVKAGGSLVSAMFTGRKVIAGRPADADSYEGA